MKKVPIGVKIISILEYIVATVFVLHGLFWLVAGSSVIAAPRLAVLGALGGFIAVVIGVCFFFVAYGMWKGRQWARIVTIILMVVNILFVLTQARLTGAGTSGSLGSIIVLLYLFLSDKAKRAFA